MNITLEDQRQSERLFAKFNLIPCLKEHLSVLNLDAFYTDLLAHLLVHRRATPEVLVGILFHHHNDVQATADAIAKALDAGLIGWDGERLVTKIQVPPALQHQLDLFQYPLPLLVPPNEVRTNTDSGYYTRKASVFLNQSHHNKEACLNHLNTMNRIPLTLNKEVLNQTSNKWNTSTPEAQEAFIKFNHATEQVMQFMIEAGNRFYLDHRYDKRGRTYASGYHINYQGNDWQKAVIELADKELIGE